MINIAHIFCLTRGPTRSWRNGDAKCCQLSDFADPFSAPPPPPPFKKVHSNKSLDFAQTLFSFWYSPVQLRKVKVEVLLSQRAHLSLSLSLSLSLCASALFSARQRGAALSVKHRYYVASLILHDASIADITAQLLPLSYVYLISSDDGSIIRIFVQINILELRGSYVVLMGHVSVTISNSSPCLTTETVKYINENRI